MTPIGEVKREPNFWPEYTAGTLLGGRIRYAQPVDGYRTGLEPVLLAAAIPARPGQTVLEAGTGAGAGLLCLAARVAGLRSLGIERDPAMAALAQANAAANGQAFEISTADVTTARLIGPVDHAFANPPWHDPASTRSADARRDAATHRETDTLPVWIVALSAAIQRSGTLTLVLPASLAAEAMALLLGAGLGRMSLVPFWPRMGKPAKLVLVQARHGGGPSRVSPGLVLHGHGNDYTEAANAILRDGAPLAV